MVAGGAVVLRDSATGEPEVLVVHRPLYDDWSLPKGKPDPDEDLAVTAVREVFEETGCQIRVSLPLGVEHYPIGKGTKAVHWWRGHLLAEHPWGPSAEVDKVEWLPVSKARRRLSYDDEKDVLDRALASEPTGTLVIVRHAKAMDRKHWSGGKDWKRPLGARGRRQSKRLAALLSAYGVRECHSSSSTRCVQTFQPYSELAKVPLVEVDALTEESFEDDPKALAKVMRRLVRRSSRWMDRPLAVCGHRPVLPLMRESIGMPHKAMLIAEAQVLHVDGEGHLVAEERVKSRF